MSHLRYMKELCNATQMNDAIKGPVPRWQKKNMEKSMNSRFYSFIYGFMFQQSKNFCDVKNIDDNLLGYDARAICITVKAQNQT